MTSTQNGEETTFNFYFQGIGSGLDGSMIYAVLYDGHQPVKSDTAYISVVEGAKTPPTTNVPASVELWLGDVYDLECAAEAYDGAKLSYLWYSTSTGKLQDIIALGRGSETEPTLHLVPTETGTTYYVCMVTTESGGSAYTSVIPVTVTVAETTKVSETTKAPEPSTTAALVTEAAPGDDSDEKPVGTPIWAVASIAGGAMLAGVGLTVLVMKKKR